MSNTVDFITMDQLLPSLRDKLNDNGLVIKSLDSSDLDLKGEHFASAVGQIRVTYADSKSEEKSLSMFVKYVADNEAQRNTVASIQLFFKEIRFYDTVLPALETFLRESSATGIRLNFPICYYTNYDGVRDVIALQDIKEMGFRLHPYNTIGHDVAHAKLILKAVADFHSVSFAMMKKTGYPNLSECPFLEEKYLAPEGKLKFNESCVNSFNIALPSFENIDEHRDMVDTLKRLKEKAYDIAISTLQNPGPFKVLCHRDCWNNNMMFRYAQDGTPTDVMLLDLQVTSITSLTVDLNDYFVMSTSVDFRKKHLTMLLRYYYDTLVSNLSSFGIDSCGFTFEEMVEDYRRRSALMLPFLPTIAAFLLMSKEDMEDPSNAEDDDPIGSLVNMVNIIAFDPKHRDTYQKAFAGAFQEMIYSFETSGVQY